MRGTAFLFFMSATLYVFAGMFFGLYMSGTEDFSLASAHAHLNLVGWVCMALFGIYYHLVPVAGQAKLAKVHFAVASLGLWLMVPGIAMAIKGMTPLPAILGSVLTFLSMTIFVVTVFRSRNTT